MKIIIISGPSGSGKTTLSGYILEKFNKGIVLSTDNYYKTGLIYKILSKLIKSYFDKKISFNYKLFKKDLDFIVKNGKCNHIYIYDFAKKVKRKFLKEKTNIKYLIIEGIFAREVLRNIYKEKIFLIEIKINKNECMKRVISRDIKERGKSKRKAQSLFNKSWNLYYRKLFNSKISPNLTIDCKKSDTDLVIKKIANLLKT